MIAKLTRYRRLWTAPESEPAPPVWETTSRRLKVLVESEDMAERWAITRVFKESGFEVVACGGPHTLAGGSCRLIADGVCPTAAGADVVFHRFNLGDAAHEEVLLALKKTYPTTPIVVEIPEPQSRRFAQLLEGCQVVFMPAGRAAMVTAITQARERAAAASTASSL